MHCVYIAMWGCISNTLLLCFVWKVTFPADIVLPHAAVVAPGLIAAGFPQRGTCLWLHRESLLPQLLPSNPHLSKVALFLDSIIEEQLLLQLVDVKVDLWETLASLSSDEYSRTPASSAKFVSFLIFLRSWLFCEVNPVVLRPWRRHLSIPNWSFLGAVAATSCLGGGHLSYFHTCRYCIQTSALSLIS